MQTINFENIREILYWYILLKKGELEMMKFLAKIAEKYATAEQKDPVKIDYAAIESLGTELIEDDLITIEDNTLRHNSLKLSALVFNYLMRN